MRFANLISTRILGTSRYSEAQARNVVAQLCSAATQDFREVKAMVAVAAVATTIVEWTEEEEEEDLVDRETIDRTLEVFQRHIKIFTH